MLRDKSRILLFGALAVLFITLLNGGFSFHGIGIYHFHGWAKIALIAFAIYLLVGRGCCCGGNGADAEDDSADEAEANDDESTESEDE